jgi:hypothetical protein
MRGAKDSSLIEVSQIASRLHITIFPIKSKKECPQRDLRIKAGLSDSPSKASQKARCVPSVSSVGLRRRKDTVESRGYVGFLKYGFAI